MSPDKLIETSMMEAEARGWIRAAAWVLRRGNRPLADAMVCEMRHLYPEANVCFVQPVEPDVLRKEGERAHD